MIDNPQRVCELLVSSVSTMFEKMKEEFIPLTLLFGDETDIRYLEREKSCPDKLSSMEEHIEYADRVASESGAKVIFIAHKEGPAVYVMSLCSYQSWELYYVITKGASPQELPFPPHAFPKFRAVREVNIASEIITPGRC